MATNGKDEVLKKTFESVENLWIGVLERAVASKQVMGFGLRWMDLKLRARRSAQWMVGRAADFWGLPTANDVQELQQLLTRMEGRLLELEERLVEAQPAAGLAAPSSADAPEVPA